MSRAYRVSVSESVTQIICVDDEISTNLDLLEILPQEEMATLLEGELKKDGFEKNADGQLERQQEKVTILVDPQSAKVTVRANGTEEVTKTQTQTGHYYDDVGPGKEQREQQLLQSAQDALEKQLEEEKQRLQDQITSELEGSLEDVRRELGQAVNRTTAEALKRKASRMGQIKEMTQDPDSGSLTIVVEV